MKTQLSFWCYPFLGIVAWAFAVLSWPEPAYAGHRHDLVVWYKFEGNLKDSSGNGNDATAGAGTERFDPGRRGQALYLDGSTFINCGDPTNEAFGHFNFTGAITIGAWIKLDAPAADLTQAYLPVLTKINSWALRIRQGRLGGVVTNWIWPDLPGTTSNQPSNWDPSYGSVGLSLNQWYHVAITYNGEFKSLYLNGRFVFGFPVTGAFRPSDDITVDTKLARTRNVCIGHDISCDLPYRLEASEICKEGTNFKGWIDDLRVYSRALSAEEIRDLGWMRPPATGEEMGADLVPVIYWDFDACDPYDRELNHGWLPSVAFDVNRNGLDNTADETGYADGPDTEGPGTGLVIEGLARRGPGRPTQGGALYLDGIDDAAHSPSGALDWGAFTMSLWLHPLPPAEARPNTVYWLLDGLFGYDRNECIVDADRRLVARLAFSDGAAPETLVELTSRARLSRGFWTHVALSHDSAASELVWYINGARDVSTTVSGKPRTGDSRLTLARSTEIGLISEDFPVRAFRGLVDEFRLYREALLEPEIWHVARFGRVFVEPGGSPVAWGTPTAPVDLRTALNNPSVVRSGDRVVIASGNYCGPFAKTALVCGTEANPIRYVAGAPGATILPGGPRGSGKSKALLLVNGDYVRFEGLEITHGRATDLQGFADAVRLQGGRGARLINLVIHDNPGQNGIGLFRGGEDVGQEIYGCVVYRNGGEPAHGQAAPHAIYAQGSVGQPERSIEDCLLFQNAQIGLNAYSAKLPLANLRMTGIVSWGNGHPRGSFPNLLVRADSGYCKDIELRECFTYQSAAATGGKGADFGVGSNCINSDVVIRDCVFVGGSHAVQLAKFQGLTFTNNIIYARDKVAVGLERLSLEVGANRANSNTYYLPSSVVVAFELDFGGRGIHRYLASEGPQWQVDIGWNGANTFTSAAPGGVWKWIRPNKYDQHRAHLVIYNWEPDTLEVAVDLGREWNLSRGNTFSITNVEDIWGAAAVEGTYAGLPVNVPLAGVGRPNLPSTGPEFGCYLIRVHRSGFTEG
jgi:hypothetical protein